MKAARFKFSRSPRDGGGRKSGKPCTPTFSLASGIEVLRRQEVIPEVKDFVKQRMTNVEDLWANTDYSMIRTPETDPMHRDPGQDSLPPPRRGANERRNARGCRRASRPWMSRSRFRLKSRSRSRSRSRCRSRWRSWRGHWRGVIREEGG